MIESSTGKDRENGILYNDRIIRIGTYQFDPIKIFNSSLELTGQKPISPLVPLESLSQSKVKKILDERLPGGWLGLCIPAKQLKMGKIELEFAARIINNNVSQTEHWSVIMDKPMEDYDPDPKNTCDNQLLKKGVELKIEDSAVEGSDSVMLIQPEFKNVQGNPRVKLERASAVFPDKLVCYHNGLRGVCINPHRSTVTIFSDDQYGECAYATFRYDKSPIELLYATNSDRKFTLVIKPDVPQEGV